MGPEEEGVSPAVLHRLTPLDIHNKEFRKVFRGYSEDEVDEFLDLVVAEFERLLRTNDELQSRISGLEARVDHYKGLEETLKNAIVLAQKTAEEIKEAAAREAEAIKRQAMAEADRIKSQAERILEESVEKTEAQRSRLLRFRAELRTFLQSQIEMVDESVDAFLRRLEDQSTDALRER